MNAIRTRDCPTMSARIKINHFRRQKYYSRRDEKILRDPILGRVPAACPGHAAGRAWAHAHEDQAMPVPIHAPLTVKELPKPLRRLAPKWSMSFLMKVGTY